MKGFKPAALILQNRVRFPGISPEWQTGVFQGEVVFTTGMTGYPESLTDPSYTGQILVFTYPLIGNYGVPEETLWESAKIHVKGIVVSEVCSHWFHYESNHSLLEWLRKQKIPLIAGVDTRALTKLLRSHGTLLGAISSEKNPIVHFLDPNKEHLVAQAASPETTTYSNGPKTILAVDCGMKENIRRELLKWPLTVRRVPFNCDFKKEKYDGIFLSNGPGDPVQCREILPLLQHAFKEDKPVFGICLGTQLMALAAGATTYKLPFGHRGQNQPCLELETEKCYLTSQNHGFAVDERSLPSDWKVTFKNLNDDSVEGIAHQEKPFFAVQFHPEAAPGPTDTTWLFEKFYQALCNT